MEKYSRLLILICVAYQVDGVILQDEKFTLPQLIRYWGYPIEIHEALTEDGYFLTLHRIPRGRYDLNKTDSRRPVMFLQHGLLCSSSNWVVNLPHQSLGFMLADAGFDVWMGNIRGSTFSMKHQQHSTKSAKFWDFSIDEHAKYDLPAMLKYTLNKTGEQDLYYVGHSQGSLIALAEFGSNEDLQKRVKLFFALAPVSRINYQTGILRYIAKFEYGIKLLFKILRIRNFLPSVKSLKWYSDKFCPIYQELCDKITFVSTKEGLKNFNRTRTAVYLRHTPAGTSVKNMYHYLQLIRNKRFQKYDYGLWENYKKYKSWSPAVYDLKSVKNKIMIFYGDSDWLSIPQDVQWLAEQLPNLIDVVKIKNYNHLDFVWGLSARKLVYDRIIETARSFE